MKTWQDTKDARIKKRDGVYWARFMKKGQQVQKSLKTKNFELAKAQVENIESDILLGVNWRRADEPFETAWPEFLADKHLGVKTKVAREKTLKEYIGFGERYFLPQFSKLRLSEIDENTWADMVRSVRSAKPDMHFDNLRKYLMGFLSWAYRKGKIRTKPELFDPDVARKQERDVDGPGVAYTIDQLKKMQTLAHDCGERFYLFVLMCQRMGMRPGEVSQLKKDRIDLGPGLIRLRKSDTKTAQARVIPIPDDLMGPVASLMSSHEGPYLFRNMHDENSAMDPQGFKKYWSKIREELGIEGRVYDFRHTFITHALAQGMNPCVVAMITGTSLKMIQDRYLHLTAEDMRSAIEGFKI